MLAKIFLNLTDYPFFRRMIWKPIYEVLAKRLQIQNWHFMNYGYVPSADEKPLTLLATDEINRYPIQLYHYLATKIDRAEREVLEVGSGRGGGSSYIRRYLNPKNMTGVDIAYNAINFSKNEHTHDGLHYVQGNAEKLPLKNECFDAVINVESCHAYGSVPKFLSEVNRVLKPGGYFLCTDMRSPNGMNTLRKNLLNSGMQILLEEDISINVVDAIESEESLKQKRISEHIPSWFQSTFKEFAGVKGSQIHEGLKNGVLVYHRFVLKK
jgi:ubiquinone/menaquinone biosynthesis C-methylase UbiE